MTGTSIGPYRVIDRLGAGGMGEVYLAEDPRLDRLVALKRPSDDWLSAPDARDRLQKEARTAASLNHPNIASVYDVLDYEGRPYIVMEYVPGESLAERLRRGPLSLDQSVDFGRQLADALVAAHAQGIIHRDLKPGNVVLIPDGRVKVLDFGLAKTRGALKGAPRDRHPESLSGPGRYVGTPGYSSPEQLSGEKVDTRTDLFSLGVILYEMLTGASPFRRADAMATALATMSEPVAPARTVPPLVPPALDALVEGLLAKDARRRLPSAAQAAADLGRIQRDLREAPTTSGEMPLVTPPALPWRPRWTRSRLLGAAAALVIVAALGVVGWRLSQRAAPPAGAPAGAPTVLAIVPFSDPVPGDGLAAGLQDMLANDLTAAAGLLVVPTAAMPAADGPDLQRAARAQGTDYLLRGSFVDPESGGRRNLELSLTPSDGARAVWRMTYRGTPDELLRVEPAMAAEVAKRLGSAVGEHQTPTTSVRAFGFYGQARGFLDRRDIPGNVERAITLFKSAIQDDPQFALAYAGLGEAYWQMYKATKDPQYPPLAQDRTSEALSLRPDLPLAHVAMAMIYGGTGRADFALRELDQANALNPSDAAYRLRGQIEFGRGRLDEAFAAFDRAIALNPNNFANYMDKATAALKAGRFREATAPLEQAARLQPDSAKIYELLGIAHQELGESDKALEEYEHAIQLGPSAAVYSNLGILYAHAGRDEDAAAASLEAVKLRPKDPLLRQNLGDAYARLHRDADAREQYQQAVDLSKDALLVNPHDPATLGRLAICEAKLGEGLPAREHARQAFELNPSDNQVLYRMAVVEALLRNREAAFGYLARALAAGYSRTMASRDEDLTSLRSDKRFQALVATPPAQKGSQS